MLPVYTTFCFWSVLFIHVLESQCLVCTFYICYFACFILEMSRLGSCPSSGLVCALLQVQLRGYLPEGALPEGQPESQSEWGLLGGHRPRGALPALVGGHHWFGRYVPW